MEMNEKFFLGVGWKFPVTVEVETEAGEEILRMGKSRYVQAVEESIRIILGTAKGERIMRPDFGADLQRLVFAPNNTSTAGLAIFYVREALQRWEPRIELISVDADPDERGTNRLIIVIDYRIISTNTEHNLVYPFYLGAKE